MKTEVSWGQPENRSINHRKKILEKIDKILAREKIDKRERERKSIETRDLYIFL